MESKQKPNRAAGCFMGCVTWILVFGGLLSCLPPIVIFGGLVSGFMATDIVVPAVGPMLCPADTEPYINTYPTTSIGENGVEYPSTAVEMLCRQADGSSVEPSMDYQNAWIGLLGIAGLILSGVLSIFIAGPVGILVNKLLDRMRKRL